MKGIKRIKSKLNSKEILYRNIPKDTDLIINCSNGILKAHSLVLKENNVFNILLSSNQNTKEKEINIPQFSMEVIRIIMEYIYRGKSKTFLEINEELDEALKYFFQGIPCKVECDDDSQYNDLKSPDNLLAVKSSQPLFETNIVIKEDILLKNESQDVLNNPANNPDSIVNNESKDVVLNKPDSKVNVTEIKEKQQNNMKVINPFSKKSDSTKKSKSGSKNNLLPERIMTSSPDESDDIFKCSSSTAITSKAMRLNSPEDEDKPSIVRSQSKNVVSSSTESKNQSRILKRILNESYQMCFNICVVCLKEVYNIKRHIEESSHKC